MLDVWVSIGSFDKHQLDRKSDQRLSTLFSTNSTRPVQPLVPVYYSRTCLRCFCLLLAVSLWCHLESCPYHSIRLMTLTLDLIRCITRTVNIFCGRHLTLSRSTPWEVQKQWARTRNGFTILLFFFRFSSKSSCCMFLTRNNGPPQLYRMAAT